ncbi:MAG: response regulator [Alphaproteobacteria bacterium]|nr:response regulator [Alphaproteobacteria bacterium]
MSQSQRIDFAKISFLIVDTNPLAIDMMNDILRMLGAMRIFRATHVDRAIDLLGNEEIDIVITERELGDQSGLELLDLVRNSSVSPNRMLPVIMLTANSEPEHVIEARDSGVTEFVAKPFTVESLYRRLVSVIARPRSFVNAESYFGPDRRRKQIAFSGPDRRAE